MIKPALIALFAAASAFGATIQTEPVTVTTVYGDTLTVGGASFSLHSPFDVTISGSVSTDDTERFFAWQIRQPVTVDAIEIGQIPWWLLLRVNTPTLSGWQVRFYPASDLLVGGGSWVVGTTLGPPLVRTGPLGATLEATATYTIVPEPAAIGLCGIALSMIALYRRSRSGKRDPR